MRPLPRPLVAATLLALAVSVLVTGGVADAAPDTLPPQTTITDGPDGPTAVGRVTFAFAADEPNSTFECAVDDEAFSACESPYTTAPQVQGTHAFRARATDSSGNVDPTPAEQDFVVDKSISGANVSARRSQRLSGRAVVVRITVRAGEEATVAGDGTVDVGKRRIALRGEEVLVPPGGVRTISLTPRSSRDARRVRKAIKRDGKALATVTAKFSDALGNEAISGDVDVKLKGR